MNEPKNLALKRILFFLLLVFFSSLAYRILPNTKTPTKPTENQIPKTAPVETLKPTTIKENTNTTGASPVFQKISEIKNQTSTPIENEKKLTATLTVNDKKYPLQFNLGENLYLAMQYLQTTNKNFSFTVKEYPNLGIFVNEINDIKNDSAKNNFWIYYINGESAKMGISLYNLKANDLVEWKFKKGEF